MAKIAIVLDEITEEEVARLRDTTTLLLVLGDGATTIQVGSDFLIMDEELREGEEEEDRIMEGFDPGDVLDGYTGQAY